MNVKIQINFDNYTALETEALFNETFHSRPIGSFLLKTSAQHLSVGFNKQNISLVEGSWR